MGTLEKDCRTLYVRASRLTVFGVLLCVLPALAQQQPVWLWEVHERVAARQMGAALEVADRRLAEDPADLEARGWRARLLAWSDRLPEAAAEYRRVLEQVPEDTDILAGLADVFARQQRWDEAMALLNQARELDPSRPDLLAQRARVWRSMGRVQEAHEDFRAAATLDPGNVEAKAGLASLGQEPRHELHLGTDTDSFNFTTRAWAQTASLSSQWSPRWATIFAGNFYQRSGQDAGRFASSVTYRFSRKTALTAGGAVARDLGIIPRAEAFFEYGQGFRRGEAGLLRGVETSYRQNWLWFNQARILTLTGTAVVYLPKEWTWSLALTGARSHFPAVGPEWRPSGITRLGMPLHRRVTANLFYAVGTENFARIDQLGRFSARTFGGGARFRLTPQQDIAGYVSYQNRSQGRTQLSFGFSYGIRF